MLEESGLAQGMLPVRKGCSHWLKAGGFISDQQLSCTSGARDPARTIVRFESSFSICPLWLGGLGQGEMRPRKKAGVRLWSHVISDKDFFFLLW